MKNTSSGLLLGLLAFMFFTKVMMHINDFGTKDVQVRRKMTIHHHNTESRFQDQNPYGGTPGAQQRLHWKNVREINGLKNREMIILIHSTWAGNGKYYRDRVIPSIRTWMRLTSHALVMIEDNANARLAFRNCPMLEDDNFTSFKCPQEPTVILSRVCDEDSTNSSGNFCCKVEELVRYLAFSRPEIYRDVKYALVGDDDYYFRVDRIMEWLSFVENANISQVPLIANGFTQYVHSRDKWPGCSEIVTYGWYGLNLFNKAALDKLAHVSSTFSFTHTCADWHMAQDIGLGLFGWLLEFSHINIPGVDQIRSAPHKTPEDWAYIDRNIVFHHVYQSSSSGQNPCDVRAWPASMKYNQADVIGCGNNEKPAPSHDQGFSMYDLWDYFSKKNISEKSLTLPEGFWEVDPTGINPFPVPVVRPLVGYNHTKHWQRFGKLDEWHDFKREDCEDLDVLSVG